MALPFPLIRLQFIMVNERVSLFTSKILDNFFASKVAVELPPVIVIDFVILM